MTQEEKITENEFIVGEVSKNWYVGSSQTDLLSQRFELIINRNDQRGYKLVEWKIDRTVSSDGKILNETVIAIFQKKRDSTT